MEPENVAQSDAIENSRDATSSGDNSTTVASSPVRHGDNDDGTNDTIDIKIKTLDRTMYNFSVSPNMPVREFRKLVKEASNIEEHRQRIIFRGKILQDGETLATHRLESGHTLLLCARSLAAATRASNESETSEAESASTAHPGADAAWGFPGEALRSAILSNHLQSALGNTLRGAVPLSRLRPGNFSRPPSTRMEHVWQGLMTLNTLMSTMHVAPTDTDLDWQQNPANVVESADRDSETNHNGEDNDGGENANHTSESQRTTRLASELASAFNEEEPSNGSVNVDSETNDAADSKHGVCNDSRKFFVGQWLDVKDTVNQWLEATILRMSATRLYIHYNGWPSRWDEWIEHSSDRIAPFRTKTLHPPSAPHMSPSPVAWVQDMPVSGPDDVRPLISSVKNMMEKTMPMISKFRELCAQSEKRDKLRIARERQVRGESNDGAKHPEHVSEDDGASKEDTTVSERRNDDCDLDTKSPEAEALRAYATELAPVLDRLGRVVSDLAPHVAELSRNSNASRVNNDREDDESAFATSAERPLVGTATTASRGGDHPNVPTGDRPDISEDGNNAFENEDSFRSLISTHSNAPRLARQHGNVDIHIHAILTPWRNALAAANGPSAAMRGAGGNRPSASSPSSTSTVSSSSTLETSSTVPLPSVASDVQSNSSISNFVMSMLRNSARSDARESSAVGETTALPASEEQRRSNLPRLVQRRVFRRADDRSSELHRGGREMFSSMGESEASLSRSRPASAEERRRRASTNSDAENDDAEDESPSACAQQID